MRISDILKILYFPLSKIENSDGLLVDNIIRAIQKDWKIKILILVKQHGNPLSFVDFQSLEGKSLAMLLKKDGIEVDDIPPEITTPLSEALLSFIQKYGVSQPELLNKTRHYLIKTIAQELIDYTTRQKIPAAFEHSLMSYFPTPFVPEKPKARYFIPEKHYRKCLHSCIRIVQSAIQPTIYE